MEFYRSKLQPLNNSLELFFQLCTITSICFQQKRKIERMECSKLDRSTIITSFYLQVFFPEVLPLHSFFPSSLTLYPLFFPFHYYWFLSLPLNKQAIWIKWSTRYIPFKFLTSFLLSHPHSPLHFVTPSKVSPSALLQLLLFSLCSRTLHRVLRVESEGEERKREKVEGE